MFGALYASLIVIYALMFYRFIQETQQSKRQTPQQRYYVRVARNFLVLSTFVSLAASGYVVVAYTGVGTPREIGAHWFNAALTICALLFRMEKVELVNIKSKSAEHLHSSSNATHITNSATD